MSKNNCLWVKPFEDNCSWVKPFARSTTDIRHGLEMIPGKPSRQELYDHTNDKIEAKNVAKNSEYRVELHRHEQLRKLGWRHIRERLDELISQDTI